MSLFSRVKGNSENEIKIPVHTIHACMTEVSRGGMTLDEAAAVMELLPDELDDFISVLGSAEISTDPHRFSSRVFNYLMLVERGVEKYQPEPNFWQMISDESAK